MASPLSPTDQDIAFLAEGEELHGTGPTPTPEVKLPASETPPAPPKPPEGDEPPVAPPAEPKPGEEVEPPAKKEGEEEPPTEPEKPEVEPEEFEATASRPSLKEFRDKYPTALKEFPHIREAYYLEGQYRQIIPGGPEQAKELVDKGQAWDQMEETVIAGDPGHLMDTVHQNNPGALRALVHNFLPSLQERSADLYREVTDPLAANLIRWVFAKGVNNKDINYQNAAKIFSKALYDTFDIPDQPKPFSGRTDQGDSEEVKKLKAELAQRDGQVSTKFHQDYMANLKTSFIKEFTKGLDPDGVLNEFVKDALINSAITEIGTLLHGDPAHVTRMKNLLVQAAKSGYAAEYGPKLISAYLGGARPHLPGLRRKLLEKAIGKQSATPPAPKPPGGRQLPTGGKPPVEVKSNYKDDDIDWSKTTPEQYLADEVTLKKK